MEGFGRRLEDSGLTSNRDILVRIDERLSNHLAQYSLDKDARNKSCSRHESRISKLENDRAKAIGGAAVISFIIAWFVKTFK